MFELYSGPAKVSFCRDISFVSASLCHLISVKPKEEEHSQWFCLLTIIARKDQNDTGKYLISNISTA